MRYDSGMRRILPLGLLVLLAACGGDDAAAPDAAGPPQGAMTVTVDHYEYRFDVTTRDGHAILDLTVTGAGNCVTLPFRATLGGGTAVLGTAAAEITVDEDAGLLTACGAGWEAGTELQLELRVAVAQATWGGSQVGYSITNDANSVPFYYLVSWVGGCDQFAPCDHAADRFATYRFVVTHPEGVVALCPGTLGTMGPTMTTCEFDLPGGPTYSTFGIAASAGWTQYTSTWNGLDVAFYDRTGSRVLSDLDETWQVEFLAWMEGRFGAYPYGTDLRVITAPTYWAGFEHPGNIVLSDSIGGGFGNVYRVNNTMAHELAHQWAGDETTLADTYDFVWKESMAEYLPFVFEEETARTTPNRAALSWKGNADGSAYHLVPEERPPLLDYYGHVYAPGPMILFRQLEVLYSREAVLEAIAAVLGEERALSVDEVQVALEDATGADLDEYFDVWVRGTGAPVWPEFTIATSDAGPGAVDVTVTQTAPAEPRPCGFAVRLTGANPEDVLDVRFTRGGLAGEMTETVAANVPFAITGTELDPLAECLAYPAAAATRAPRRAPGWTPWRP
jgi:aminopeptidase N